MIALADGIMSTMREDYRIRNQICQRLIAELKLQHFFAYRFFADGGLVDDDIL